MAGYKILQADVHVSSLWFLYNPLLQIFLPSFFFPPSSSIILALPRSESTFFGVLVKSTGFESDLCNSNARLSYNSEHS